MEFLADENVAPYVISVLREKGFPIRTIQENHLTSAPDEKIIAFAKKNKLIVITHDKDFGNILHYPVQSHAGVILLRLKNQSPPNVAKHLLALLQKIDLKRLKNRLAILKEKQVKIF